jgi:GAF domain-containing protein
VITDERAFGDAYRRALADAVRQPGEDALNAAYELGRNAVRARLGLLDLATMHQAALGAVVREAEDPGAAVSAAGDFFLEALSAFEVVQRVLEQSRQTAAAERRQAEVLRRLSSFLGDASIACDAEGATEELLQLVAEHAGEIVPARHCRATLLLDGDRKLVVTAGDAEPSGPSIAAPLRTLDGREIGQLELSRSDRRSGFSELDAALLAQLAQMASAAVERARLYRAGQTG